MGMAIGSAIGAGVGVAIGVGIGPLIGWRKSRLPVENDASTVTQLMREHKRTL
jgi:predicted MFS family arabinose efflux permease